MNNTRNLEPKAPANPEAVMEFLHLLDEIARKEDERIYEYLEFRENGFLREYLTKCFFNGPPFKRGDDMWIGAEVKDLYNEAESGEFTSVRTFLLTNKAIDIIVNEMYFDEYPWAGKLHYDKDFSLFYLIGDEGDANKVEAKLKEMGLGEVLIHSEITYHK